MPAPIYLDHNATTPLATEVAEAMATALRNSFGNPSSVYSLGQVAPPDGRQAPRRQRNGEDGSSARAPSGPGLPPQQAVTVQQPQYDAPTCHSDHFPDGQTLILDEAQRGDRYDQVKLTAGGPSPAWRFLPGVISAGVQIDTSFFTSETA